MNHGSDEECMVDCCVVLSVANDRVDEQHMVEW